MKRIHLCVCLSLVLTAFADSFASHRDSNSKLASVSLIGLDRRPVSLQPASSEGLILVAVSDCSFLQNGKNTVLKAGEYLTIPGTTILSPPRSDAFPFRLVVVKVLSAFQSLTIQSMTLTAHQTLEDANDRNATLLIAIDPLELDDARNEAAEGEPWRSGEETIISLNRGQFTWLPPGIHRIKNTEKTPARFITIEW